MDKLIHDFREVISQKSQIFKTEIDIRHRILEKIAELNLKVPVYISNSYEDEIPEIEFLNKTTFTLSNRDVVLDDLEGSVYSTRKVIPMLTSDNQLYFVVKSFQ